MDFSLHSVQLLDAGDICHDRTPLQPAAAISCFLQAQGQ